jgi:hypothetical protein
MKKVLLTIGTLTNLVVLGVLLQASKNVSIDQVDTMYLELPTTPQVREFEPVAVSRVKRSLDKKEVNLKVVPPVVKVIRKKKAKKVSIRKDRVLPVLKLNPIKKEIVIAEANIDERADEDSPLDALYKHYLKIEEEQTELNNKMPVENFGYATKGLSKTNWTAYLENKSIGKELERLAKVEAKNKKIEKVAYNPTDNQLVKGFTNDEPDMKDILKVTQASVKKKGNKNLKNKNKNKDELVFFDYPEITKAEIENKKGPKEKMSLKNKEMTNRPKEELTPVLAAAAPSQLPNFGNKLISPEVIKVIEREMNRPVRIGRNVARANPKKKSKRKEKVIPAPVLNVNSSMTSQVSLSFYEAEIGKGIIEETSGLQFIPSYDKNETIRDDQDGRIVIDYSLSADQGNIRGTVIKYGFMRTNIEISLDTENDEFLFPLVTVDSITKYLDENELEGYGGYLLVDIGDQVEDVDIDSEYEQRIFLDEKFKSVTIDKEFHYILFLGITPGNALVKYLTIEGDVAEKVTHIAMDELSVELARIEQSSLRSIELYEEQVISKKPYELDIQDNEIGYFNNKTAFSKKGTNYFEYKRPSLPRGMRTYLKLDHLNSLIYAGHSDLEKITVPSETFIKNILMAHDMDGLNHECVVQLKVKKKLKDVKMDAESINGSMPFETSYLRENGKLGQDIHPDTDHIFLVGQEQGVFNIRLDYLDGTSDYLQTFCSDGTYLIETL